MRAPALVPPAAPRAAPLAVALLGAVAGALVGAALGSSQPDTRPAVATPSAPGPRDAPAAASALLPLASPTSRPQALTPAPATLEEDGLLSKDRLAEERRQIEVAQSILRETTKRELHTLLRRGRLVAAATHADLLENLEPRTDAKSPWRTRLERRITARNATARRRDVSLAALAQKRTAKGADPRASVAAALTWLRAHQNEDGSWSCSEWQTHCTGPKPCEGPGPNQGQRRYDVGVTSLAVLALLGSPKDPDASQNRDAAELGVRWLIRKQKADGSVGYPGRGPSVYNHALATWALVRASSLKVPAAADAAQRAVALCLRAQNPGLGWKYGARSGRNDTSVTGWMVHALVTAKRAGFAIPEEALTGARRWFVRATASSGEAGYSTPGGGSTYLPPNEETFSLQHTMTASAVAGRLALGDSPAAKGVREGLRSLRRDPPAWIPKTLSLYYWFKGSLALSQATRTPGPDWDRWVAWRGSLLVALLPNQVLGGCGDGSWKPVFEWCLAGGRVYAVALGALTLELAAEVEETLEAPVRAELVDEFVGAPAKVRKARTLADGGDARAMFRVAFALESGWKNSRGERHPNLIAAASWHRRAIRAGNTVSLRRLRRLLARRPALELPEDAQLLR